MGYQEFSVAVYLEFSNIPHPKILGIIFSDLIENGIVLLGRHNDQ